MSTKKKKLKKPLHSIKKASSAVLKKKVTTKVVKKKTKPMAKKTTHRVKKAKHVVKKKTKPVAKKGTSMKLLAAYMAHDSSTPSKMLNKAKYDKMHHVTKGEENHPHFIVRAFRYIGQRVFPKK